LLLALIIMTADEINKDKLGGTGGMNGTTEKYIYCLVEKHGEKSCLEDLNVDGKRLFVCLKRNKL